MPQEHDRPATKFRPAAPPVTTPSGPLGATPPVTPRRPSSLRRPRPTPAAPASQRVSRAWARHPVVSFFGHSSRMAFYRQLHSLVKSGAGMPVALTEMARYAPDRRSKAVLGDIARDVAAGQTLAQAFSRHGSRFDDATLEMLVFAEETGTLEAVLARILDQQEKQQKLRWTAIMGALWPAYLFGGYVFVEPLFQVAGALAQSQAADGMAVYLHGLFGNLVLAVLCLSALFCAPLAIAACSLDGAWDAVKLRLPVAGRVFRAGYASRFFMALGVTLAAGIEVVKGLRIAIRASGSPLLLGRADAAEERLHAGGTLTDAVEALGIFTPAQFGTLAIGERTGTLEKSCEQLALENQEAAARGSRLLLMVVLALVAVIAILAVLAPMLRMIFGPIANYYRTIGGPD